MQVRQLIPILLVITLACTGDDGGPTSITLADRVHAVLLADSIAQAGGRVFIGIKEASQGASERGPLLVSQETLSRTHMYLLGLGITFEAVFQNPAVAARMPARADLVARLRAHPNIHYIEPIFPGIYLGYDTAR